MDENDSNHSSAIQAEETKDDATGIRKWHYKKNKNATKGVAGQLYESKLNALILYRLLNDDKVKEFYLGSNLDKIGDMDDVCIKVIHEDYVKPLLILIQAKHKDNANKGIYDTELYNKNSDFYLPKNFESFIDVIENFKTIKDDVLYSHKLEDVIPHFIFYTTALCETLSQQRIKEPNNSTIDVVKKIIGSRNHGKVFQLNTPANDEEFDYKKVTNNYSISDRGVAEEFFNNLYFFTDQARQDEVGMTLVKEIAENQTLETSHLQLRPDAVFLNFYAKVHKWWLQRKPEYLRKNCNFLHSSLSDLVIDAYLSLLHYNYVSYIELYSIQFNTESMKSIQEEVFQKFMYDPPHIKANAFIINTNSVLLASIKVKDCISHVQKYKNCSYLDYNYVSKMTNIEFAILLREIQNTAIEILVIILNTTQHVMYERLENILNEFHKNIVIITEASKKIDEEISHNIVIVNDHIYGLVDLIDEEKILSNKVVVQGEEIELYKIVDDKSKHKNINAEILLNILNNEIIELGRSLAAQYTNKDWFQKRTIALHKIENNELLLIKEYPHLDTLYDIDEKIVIVNAEPGMGKSTLLSLLSAKTKMYNPKTWIVRIHLEDYSEDFNKWKKNNVDIGLRESMLLVCKAELNDMATDAADLQITDIGDVKLINKTLQGLSLFLLEIIVQSFNDGRIIFIFDGFDKMCPHYKRETVKFIQNLINKRSMNTDEKQVYGSRVWITSRPYNAAMRSLQTKLALPFSLASLTRTQQEDFYKKYWQAHISKQHLFIKHSNKQEIINNIRNFLRNVSQNIPVSPTSSIPIKVIYDTASKYLHEEYDFTEEGGECNRWVYYPRDELLKEAWHLSGIPLHMEIYAIHFVECFKKCVQFNSNKNKENPDKWNFKVNTFEFFENLHKSKLSKIFHEGKNPFIPDCRLRYKAAKKKSIKQHKMFAFWSIFDGYHLKMYWKLRIIEDDDPVSVFKDFAPMIEYIKKGNVKVGLIDSIHRGVPRFVYQALAECYAVEFIADLLKSFKSKQSIDKLAIDFIINYLLDNKVGLMTVFDQKLMSDNDLNEVLSKSRNKSIIFEVLMKQKRKNALHSVLENGFREIARILVHSAEGELNSENIANFVHYIGGYFFIYAASFDYKDLLEYVLTKIREVDSSIIDYLQEIIILPTNITNKELIVERLNTVGINLQVLTHTYNDSSAYIDEIN